METKDILLIIFPLLAGTISSYLTYYFAIKSKKDEAILKFKEEKYSNLLISLQGFVGSTASAERKKIFSRNNINHGYIVQMGLYEQLMKCITFFYYLREEILTLQKDEK